jgi:nucleoside-diphosphate-sugar epimerase
MCWYDIAKICGENQLAIESPRPGRGVAVAFRMALLFGPGGNGRGDQFLENIYAHCKRGNVFAFESDEFMETAGSSFVGPADLARAIADSLNLVTPGAYNISSGFCTWRCLIETLCLKIGVSPKLALLSRLPPGAQYVRMPQTRSYVDASLFSSRTGFVPKQDLNELLDVFVRSQS